MLFSEQRAAHLTCGWQMDSKKVILQMEFLLGRTKSEVGATRRRKICQKSSALQILLIGMGKLGREGG